MMHGQQNIKLKVGIKLFLLQAKLQFQGKSYLFAAGYHARSV
jgi:hypothetical protein